MGIAPDIITLSKSLSGFGLPLAIVLMKEELDQWKAGEHNGTFRGNNHAFVTATAALEHFWSDDAFARNVRGKSRLLAERLNRIALRHGPHSLKVKGRGMMIGIACPDGETADAVCGRAFENGLILETCGSNAEVVKCLSPLTITKEQIDRAMDILEEAFSSVLSEPVSSRSS